MECFIFEANFIRT